MVEMSRVAFMHGQSLKVQIQNDFIFVKKFPSFLPMCSSKAVEGNWGFDTSS